MKVLIAGGSGFLGSALSQSLRADGHQVVILTRRVSSPPGQLHWDGRTIEGWGHIVNEVDAVVNLSGHGLDHWPWTTRQKKRFVESRVLPGRALAAAIEKADHRPGIFVQTSGINRYGLRGQIVADESTPPADDFLGQLTVDWENATQSVEALGVRRVITRSAVVLTRRKGFFLVIALPSRLFFGGRFGDGRQALNWIHLADYIKAVRFLLENDSARGAYNLIVPSCTTNDDFMRAVARNLHRPYWFHVPQFLLRVMLGEMNVLLTEGRCVRPARLLDTDFTFEFGDLDGALKELLG